MVVSYEMLLRKLIGRDVPFNTIAYIAINPIICTVSKYASDSSKTATIAISRDVR